MRDLKITGARLARRVEKLKMSFEKPGGTICKGPAAESRVSGNGVPLARHMHGPAFPAKAKIVLGGARQRIEPEQIYMRCNICGGTEFSDMPKRPQVRCMSCGSLERTRVAALYVQHKLDLASGARILHFAPERGLSKMLRAIGGDNYRCCDIDPDLYPGLGVERFDLTRDLYDLPRGHYDLIVHNHVLEHIEGNYSAVLLRLVAALKPDGAMLFSMPILPGHFSDELIRGTHEEKVAKFGDMLHVRRFGRDFLAETLGMLFRIPADYDLTKSFSSATLEEANIPPHHWHSYTGTSIFRVGHKDVRI